MTYLLLDVESRSRADLKRVGGRRYWADPSSEVLCAVHYNTDTRDVGLWLPGDPSPARPGMILVAHNAQGFDRFACRKAWGTSIKGWVDSSEEAKKSGLPGALDALGSRRLGYPKDKVASKFTKGLSTVRRPSGNGPGVISPADWNLLSKTDKRRLGRQVAIDRDAHRRVRTYCFSDVEIMADAWEEHIEPWLDVDAEAQRVDHIVNDRGVMFDRDLAERLLECDEILRDKAIANAARVLKMSREEARLTASSPARFTEFTGAENAQAATVAELAKLDGKVGTLARTRQAMASIARGKLEAGLARTCDDSRLRDTHNYYGGHTGRWSQRGMQLHNMPRPADKFEDIDVTEYARTVLDGAFADRDAIDFLLRGTICASPGNVLVVQDFSGIEARGLAWAADDWNALDVLTGPQNPYIVAAMSIFGVPYDAVVKGSDMYAAGKIAVLACGYQGGPNALISMAEGMGVDLSKADATPTAIVKAWRRQHAPIVRLWHALQAGFVRAARGDECTVSCFRFIPDDDGTAVAIILPSGRPIVYNEVELRQGQRGPSITYNGRKPFREYLYGGKISENVIQAVCRDLLSDAMVRADADGLPIVLTVHDEIVADVKRSEAKEVNAELRRTMTQVPDWAKGMPINVDGFISRRYRK